MKTIPNDKYNIGIHSGRDHVLITVPNYWGKGPTVKDAKRLLKTYGGRLSGPWRVHAVHPETYVNGFGQLVFPTGFEPVMLDEYNPE